MLGFVTSSRVTSANSTAASIKSQIGNFLTDADTAGYGMKQATSAKASFVFEVTGGVWKMTIGDGMTADGTGAAAFKSGSKQWVATAVENIKANEGNKATAENANKLLCMEIANLFPDIKTAYIVAHCEAGKCLYVAYTADSSTAIAIPTLTQFQNGNAPWDTKTAGITSDGYTVGTAPALGLGTGEATTTA
jgi:type IV pilus assembly protein PilA